jgi:hypothetical protein
MAISRSQLLRELEPGLNALFGQEYKRYAEEHTDLFDTETSDRAFEEELLTYGFGTAPVKREGEGVAYDSAGEAWTARYTHETIALAFAITEEAIEDNLYDKLSSRYTKSLSRSMAHSKQVKAAAVYNNAFSSSFVGGDGKELLATDHPLAAGGTWANEPTTAADLNETSLEQAIIDIAAFVDDRGIKINLSASKLIIPVALMFTAERILNSNLRVGTSDNDANALKNMGMFSGGATVNHYLTDPDAWFIRTDCPNGLKHFNRVGMKTGMEGDFDTGNVRYKARERYSFGWSDPRALYGSPGA